MREPPLDLRLVPAAVLGWVAAVLGVRGHAAEVFGAGVALVVTAAVVGWVAWPAHRDRARRGSGPQTGGLAAPAVLALAGAAAVLLSCAGHLAAREAGPLRPAAQERAVVVVTGTVRGEPVPDSAPWRAGQVRVTVAVDGVAVRGRSTAVSGEVLVVGEAGLLDVPSGARVRVTGRLSPLTGRQEAALDAVQTQVLAMPGPLESVVGALRSGLRSAVSTLGPDARGLVPGAAVGDTSLMDPALADAMRTAGLTHLVAVSGQHVVVVLIAVLALAGAVRVPGRWRAPVAAAGLVGFTVLVGGGASVLRAAVMGGVGVLGLAVGRPSRPVPALSVAVLGLLVHDPWAAGMVGFQLSVASTAAIVLVAGPSVRAVGARWPVWSKGWRVRALSTVLVPAAAQSVAGPILVLVDPVVSPWAVPANVLAAPAVVPLTLTGLAATVTSPWLPAAQVLARAAAVPAGWIAGVARLAAGLPGAQSAWRPGLAGAVGLAALVAAGWLAGRLVLAPSRARQRHGPGADDRVGP